jgi:hypothetical protein
MILIENMAIKRTLLIPPELWKNCAQTSAPPPVNKILKSTDHTYDKWTQFRVHQDPYLKTEKLKREPIPIPIIETGGTPQNKLRFKIKPKRRRAVGSTPTFHTETVDTEPETVAGRASPVNSKYIQDVLKRRKSHGPAFGIYQDDTDGSFGIGSSIFK